MSPCGWPRGVVQSAVGGANRQVEGTWNEYRQQQNQFSFAGQSEARCMTEQGAPPPVAWLGKVAHGCLWKTFLVTWLSWSWYKGDLLAPRLSREPLLPWSDHLCSLHDWAKNPPLVAWLSQSPVPGQPPPAHHMTEQGILCLPHAWGRVSWAPGSVTAIPGEHGQPPYSPHDWAGDPPLAAWLRQSVLDPWQCYHNARKARPCWFISWCRGPCGAGGNPKDLIP